MSQGNQPPTDEQIKQELQKETKELVEAVQSHTLRWMLAVWLIPPLVLELLLFLGAIYSSSTGAQPVLNITLTRLETLASDVFVATITVVGLIIGFLPIISFFYLGVIKDDGKEIEDRLLREREGKSDEIKRMIDGLDYLYDVIGSHVESAVKKYTAINVMISFSAILGIIWSYITFSIQDTVNSLGWFLVISVFVLIPIVYAILPLVSMAFYAPSYKVIKHRENGRTLLAIFPSKD
jgi:magnesium-transporting ATPase (P-type)